jgi:hypothetical protein
MHSCDATAVGSLLRDDGFQVALVIALVGGGVVWWCAARTRLALPVPAVTVIAALAGLRADHHLTFRVVLALALLGVAAWGSRAGAGFVLAGVAVVAGAGLLVSAYPDRVPGWISFVVFVALLPAVPVLELRARRWARVAPLVLLGATLGVYECVPDTEYVRPLVAAAAVSALLCLLPERSVTQVGSGVVAGLLVWTVGIGGIGRAGSVVGGLACVAALVLFPASPTSWPPPRRWWVAATITGALVVWCSRVAGRVDGRWLAAVLAVLGFAVAVALRVTLAGGARLRRRRMH